MLCACLTCDALQQSTHIEDALLHDALEAHGEDGDERHGTQQQDPRRQEDGRGLPEPAGNLPEVYRVRSAQYPTQVGQFYTAAVDAQGGPVGLSGRRGPMVAEDGVRGAGVPHQPVSAHEGDELPERGHDAQQSPQHGAAGDNDMAHADGGWVLPPYRSSRRGSGGKGGARGSGAVGRGASGPGGDPSPARGRESERTLRGRNQKAQVNDPQPAASLFPFCLLRFVSLAGVVFCFGFLKQFSPCTAVVPPPRSLGLRLSASLL